MPSRKNYTSVPLSISDRERLLAIAKDWDLGLSDIIRRMARMIITEKISINEIFHAPVSQATETQKDNGRCDIVIKFSVSDSDRKKLSALAEDWGFSIALLLRTFVRAVLTGDISKDRLWVPKSHLK